MMKRTYDKPVAMLITYECELRGVTLDVAQLSVSSGP